MGVAVDDRIETEMQPWTDLMILIKYTHITQCLTYLVRNDMYSTRPIPPLRAFPASSLRILATFNTVHQYHPFVHPRWPLTAAVPAPLCPANMDLITRDPKIPGLGQIMMQAPSPAPSFPF